MSPAKTIEKTSSARSDKTSGREFEETFKPKNREASPKNLDEGKGKKKKSGFPKIIIIILIIVILIAGAGGALYFSGNLNSVLSMVGLAKNTSGAAAADQQAALDRRKAELDAREQSLNDLQKKLNAQQETLDEKMSAAEASAAANRTFEEIRAGLSEEKLTELQQVGSIYSKMDPKAAAAVMTQIYNPQQIAVIIYFMQPAASASLLAKMDAPLAASVTQLLTS